MALSRLGFDALSALALTVTALIGAYTPVFLSKRDRVSGGSGRSLAFILGNLFSAGVMVSAGFCHLLGESLRQMRSTGRFPLPTFLCGLGYMLTLVADKVASTASGHGHGHGCGGHHHLHADESLQCVAGAAGCDAEKGLGAAPGGCKRAHKHSGSLEEEGLLANGRYSHDLPPGKAYAGQGGSSWGGGSGGAGDEDQDGVALCVLPRSPPHRHHAPGSTLLHHGQPHQGGAAGGPAGERWGTNGSADRGRERASPTRRPPDDALGLSPSRSLSAGRADCDAAAATAAAAAAAAAGAGAGAVAYSTSAALVPPAGSVSGSLLLHRPVAGASGGGSRPHTPTTAYDDSLGDPILEGPAAGGGGGSGGKPRHVSFITAVLMGVALCFHSLLEGAAMGAQESLTNSMHIFIAIVSHKGLAAYALGSSIVDSQVSMQQFWSVVLPFTFASPVGIFVGYIISDIATGAGAAAISALASGTFLYVAFMEVIPKEMKDNNHLVAKLGMLLLGFGLMSLLAVWA